MPETFKMTDEVVQDYIDGRLDQGERTKFVAHLDENPADAEFVSDLQRQDVLLKKLGSRILDEPVPDRLRAVLNDARTPGMAKQAPATQTAASSPAGWFRRFVAPQVITASLVALLVGGACGWYGRGYVLPDPVTMDDIILSNGLDAYRLYGSADYSNPVEFSGDRLADLTNWLDQSFKANIKPPSLEDQGYSLIGGRILPYASGNYGFFLYENQQKARVAVICWPQGKQTTARTAPRFAPGKDYSSHYWNKNDFGFAVYGQSSNADFKSISDAVVGFYDKLFAPSDAEEKK